MKKNKSAIRTKINDEHKNKQSNNPLPSYIWSMNHAPNPDIGYHWVHMLPLVFFGAFIIMITFMKSYTAPMADFYWYNGATNFTDFFSYYKSVFIIASAVIAALFMLYRLITQSLIIRKSKLYIPLIIYSALVLLSLLFSKFPHFALHGYIDRFEGTFVLLSYVFMAFYAINTVFTEKNINFMWIGLAISSSALGILGISQYIGHDFFQTTFGKLLITPSSYKDYVDTLSFTFQSGEIYQTVYNINYVSFYLTLLIPLFGMLFIYEKNIKRKCALALVFILLIFNLIGSKSSGGILGLGISIIIGIILLNKSLIKHWKYVAIPLVIGLLIVGFTLDRFLPELTGAIKQVIYTPPQQTDTPKIDYIDTNGDTLTVSINNEPLIITADLENPTNGLALEDSSAHTLPVAKNPNDGSFTIEDPRFDMYKLQFAQGSDGNVYIVLFIYGKQWLFAVMPEGIFYRNYFDCFVDLDPIESIGFENNDKFGSGRGYIWSRSLPLLKDNLLIGSGADTYTLVFPHNDYVGKYNSSTYLENLIVDKPHNMYLQIGINTGLLSLISLLTLFIAYIIWSIKLYIKNKDFSDFINISGIGIFLGICGFLTAALVNDSSVSVSPMFWSLLGMGIAINFIVEKKITKENIA